MQIRGFRFKICSTSRSRPRFRTTQDYVIFDCGILWLSKLVHFKVRHRSLARLPAFFDVDAYRTWLARYTLRRTERVQNHVTSASYSRDPIRVHLSACNDKGRVRKAWLATAMPRLPATSRQLYPRDIAACFDRTNPPVKPLNSYLFSQAGRNPAPAKNMCISFSPCHALTIIYLQGQYAIIFRRLMIFSRFADGFLTETPGRYRTTDV